MSYFASGEGFGWSAGYFLGDDEHCTRVSATIASDHAQIIEQGDRKIVPAGAIIPANGATATGVLYENIDVTDGAKMGSVVTAGIIYEDKLPATPASAAKTALKGIQFIATSPTITRPYNQEVEG